MPITVKQVTQREHGTEYQTWLVDGYVKWEAYTGSLQKRG